jgi:hypothetical protein
MNEEPIGPHEGLLKMIISNMNNDEGHNVSYKIIDQEDGKRIIISNNTRIGVGRISLEVYNRGASKSIIKTNDELCMWAIQEMLIKYLKHQSIL